MLTLLVLEQRSRLSSSVKIKPWRKATTFQVCEDHQSSRYSTSGYHFSAKAAKQLYSEFKLKVQQQHFNDFIQI